MRVTLSVILLSMAGFAFAVGPTAWDRTYQLEAQKNFVGAAEIVKAELLNSADSEFAQTHYAYLLHLQGKYQESIDAYNKAIKTNSRNIDARLGILWPLSALSKWQDISLQARQLLEVSACDYKAYDWLVQSEQAQKNWNKLASYAQDYAKCYPTDANSLVYLARAYANRAETKKAIEIYQKVLARFPGHVEATNYLNTMLAGK